MNRRLALRTGLAAFLVGGVARAQEAAYANSLYRRMPDAEWRQRLQKPAYDVLRSQATEIPDSSPLLNEHRRGVFACIGCDLPLFSSETKFDSGTGWPSFFRAIDGRVAERVDESFGMRRVEYHCAQCLGHHGHLFDDGPAPTGLRYCSNGVALNFIPA